MQLVSALQTYLSKYGNNHECTQYISHPKYSNEFLLKLHQNEFCPFTILLFFVCLWNKIKFLIDIFYFFGLWVFVLQKCQKMIYAMWKLCKMSMTIHYLLSIFIGSRQIQKNAFSCNSSQTNCLNILFV